MTVDEDLDRVFGPDPDPKGHLPGITSYGGSPWPCEGHAHDWTTGVLSGVPYWECVTWSRDDRRGAGSDHPAWRVGRGRNVPRVFDDPTAEEFLAHREAMRVEADALLADPDVHTPTVNADADRPPTTG